MLAMQQSSTVSIFYVYAPVDHKFCEELDKHLAAMKRLGLIQTWRHSAIARGQEWEDQSGQRMEAADIVLFLISADFLESDYLSSAEFAYALQRHEAGQIILVPVIVRPVDWHLTALGQLQPLPTDGKAVINWTKRDQAFFDVSRGLRQLIERRWTDAQATTLAYRPVWTVPHRQNRFFCGREHILTQITDFFSTRHAINTPIVALNGLGGVGKTQIALEYAYRSENRYQAVFWIHASSQETLIADVVALADSLGLAHIKGLDAPAMFSTIMRWLANHAQWLLIIDAVAELSWFMDMIPVCSSGHVLLTTQTTISKMYAYSLEVTMFSEVEALEMLLQRSGLVSAERSLPQISSAEMQEAQHLCQALDGLPLALDQAAAYIEETGCSIAEYYRLYQRRRLMLLKLRGGTGLDHPDSVVTTWSLSFEHLEPRDPCAADLLRACAFLAPEAIPQQIFLAGAAHLGPHLASFGVDETRFDSAMRTLRQFAFVRRFADTQTISLHRLVQVVLYAQMEATEQALWGERIVSAICAAFPQNHDPEWKRCSLYIPHVYVCEQLVDQYHCDNSVIVGAFFHRAGFFFHEHAQYVQAKELYQRALAILERFPESVAFVSVLESLGWLALDQEQFVEAQAYFARALALKELIYGREHIEFARTLHAFGRLTHKQFQYKEAEAFYQQALQILEPIVGNEDAETARVLHSIGWLYHDLRRYDDAFIYYQRSLTIRTERFGAEHVNTATLSHQLARLAHHWKDYAQAEKLYLKALQIKEQALGPEHPFVAITMNALAQVYQDQDRLEEAETFYQRALAIREHIFGNEHHLTAESMHYLAGLYQDQGQLQQAETLLLQALKIRKQTLGPQNPATALSMHQLAQLYVIQQRWSEAEDFYRQTLAIRRQVFGEAHHATQSVKKNFIQFLYSAHRDEDARSLESESTASN